MATTNNAGPARLDRRRYTHTTLLTRSSTLLAHTHYGRLAGGLPPGAPRGALDEDPMPEPAGDAPVVLRWLGRSKFGACVSWSLLMLTLAFQVLLSSVSCRDDGANAISLAPTPRKP